MRELILNWELDGSTLYGAEAMKMCLGYTFFFFFFLSITRFYAIFHSNHIRYPFCVSLNDKQFKSPSSPGVPKDNPSMFSRSANLRKSLKDMGNLRDLIYLFIFFLFFFVFLPLTNSRWWIARVKNRQIFRQLFEAEFGICWSPSSMPLPERAEDGTNRSRKVRGSGRCSEKHLFQQQRYGKSAILDGQKVDWRDQLRKREDPRPNNRQKDGSSWKIRE